MLKCKDHRRSGEATERQSGLGSVWRNGNIQPTLGLYVYCRTFRVSRQLIQDAKGTPISHPVQAETYFMASVQGKMASFMANINWSFTNSRTTDKDLLRFSVFYLFFVGVNLNDYSCDLQWVFTSLPWKMPSPDVPFAGRGRKSLNRTHQITVQWLQLWGWKLLLAQTRQHCPTGRHLSGSVYWYDFLLWSVTSLQDTHLTVCMHVFFIKNAQLWRERKLVIFMNARILSTQCSLNPTGTSQYFLRHSFQLLDTQSWLHLTT